MTLEAHEEQRRLEEVFGRNGRGKDRLVTLRSEMHAAMEESAGIYRNEPALREAASKLRGLQERLERVALTDRSLTFNTERTMALELSCMMDVAETIVHSAIERRESRGSHQRTDHPKRDDEQFLKHSLALRGDDGTLRIQHQPVTITRWPPGERVYGR